MPDIILKDRNGNDVEYTGVNINKVRMTDGTMIEFINTNIAQPPAEPYIEYTTNDNGEVIVAKMYRFTSIPTGCFANMDYLETIDITESPGITSIGSSAFFGCTSLKRIFIPYSVEKIGATAFSFCSDLQEICIDRERDSIYGAPWSEIDIEVRWRGDF